MCGLCFAIVDNFCRVNLEFSAQSRLHGVGYGIVFGTGSAEDYLEEVAQPVQFFGYEPEFCTLHLLSLRIRVGWCPKCHLSSGNRLFSLLGL